jgi:gliding motility-associated-like protein
MNSAYLGGLAPENTDGTDNPDYLDLDSDNEGASDSEEARISIRNIDQDQDGLDHVTDTDDQAAYDDANGTIDNPSLLPDTDGDVNLGGDVDYRDASDDRLDTDQDGIIDVFDLDDDNDGILDTDECLQAGFDTGTTLAVASDDFNWKVQWIAGPADYAPPAIPEIVPAVITGNLATTAWVNAPVVSNSEWISHPFNDAIGGIGNHIDADLDGVPFERPFLAPPNGPTADFVVLRFSNTINLPTGAAATFTLNFDMAADNGSINNNITPPVEIFVNGVLQTTPKVDFDRLTNINLASDWADGDNTIEIIIYSSPPIAGLLIVNTNSTFGNCDLDGDGIVNQLDLDSDNDGIFDVVESGVLTTGALDDNDDGRIDGDPTAFGNNGLFNGIEDNDTFNATTTHTLAESADDTDAIYNFMDLDSDGDGIPDNVEAQTTQAYVPPSGSVDSNGVDTAYLNGLNPINTDGSDAPDYLDGDSDNDNVPDNIEGHDANHDGIPDFVHTGTDTDNDGLDDGFEGSVIDDFDVNDAIDDPINDLPNTDGDEESDYRDIDDDNDGIETQDEDTNDDGDYANDDVDNNGTPDYLEINYEDVEVFNVITPNGDGIHDVLTIRNIEKYPDNTINIYNRWGILIFETQGYDNQSNNFDGTSQARATMGNSDKLPTGTYFYILGYEESPGNTKSLSGYLYLNQ